MHVSPALHSISTAIHHHPPPLQTTTTPPSSTTRNQRNRTKDELRRNPKRPAGLPLPALWNHHSRRQRPDASRGQKAPCPMYSDARCRHYTWFAVRSSPMGASGHDHPQRRLRGKRCYSEPPGSSPSSCTRERSRGREEMGSSRYWWWLERQDQVSARTLVCFSPASGTFDLGREQWGVRV